MSPRSDKRKRLDDAIIADEIGIESAGYGIYRLRSLYQPIFERRGQTLHGIAVDGTAAPFLAGEQVPQEFFLTSAAEDDLDFIGQIRLALPLRNMRNIDPEGTKLLLDIAARGDNSEDILERVGFVAGELAEAELQPELVICVLSEPQAADSALLAEIVDEIRRWGLNSAIGDFGMGRWSDEQIDLLAPEVARIDGEWFRQVCRDAVTVRLFETVVARLHERGAKVLVCGIDNEQQFGIALEAGADLFQGKHLAAVANVGTLQLEPLAVRDKLHTSDKVQSLRATHHKR